MTRLIGAGIGAGMALGTAVVIHVRAGIALAPAAPPRIAKLIESHRLSELPEVILVADDYRTAMAYAESLSWARVVGVAASHAGDGDPVTGIPAVVGLKGITTLVQDDQLVLVDAIRGVVLIDPDPVFLARYTAEHDHVAPRRRFYLDDAHRRAATTDGVTVSVLAYGETVANVRSAVEQGADALVVRSEADLFTLDSDSETLQAELDTLIEAAPGKTIILVDSYRFARSVLCESALRADIILALPPRMELVGLGLGEERDAMLALERQYVEDDRPCSAPRIALSLDDALAVGGEEAANELLRRFALTGATRILVGFEPEPRSAEHLRVLSHLCDAARTYVIPIIVAVGGFGFTAEQIGDVLQDLIGIGVAGVVVGAEHVSDAKQSIRVLDAEQCRLNLLERD